MKTAPKTVKAAETRGRIIDAALALVDEVGLERATMRKVAQRAGVAPSHAYYYFRSKEELVQGFYAKTHEEHLVALEPALAEARSFGDKLKAVVRTKLETAEPYHATSAALYRAAADPRSPLNPFSEASRPTREQATGVFREILRTTRVRLPAELADDLPRLLWMWEMAIILYWIHDDSPGRRKSHLLGERTADLIVLLVRVSGLPGLGPLRRATQKLLAELFDASSPAPEGEPQAG